MTAQEFINQFDVLYNNITSNQAPNLDNYEKSVFLTKAQDEIIKAYFSPKLNKSQEGFDGSEKRQIDFSMIIKKQKYTAFNDANFVTQKTAKSVNLNTADSILMILNEQVTVQRTVGAGKLFNASYAVVPITYIDYTKSMTKPYAYPPQNIAWRLLTSESGTYSADIIIGGNETLQEYRIRYIKKPYPIILEDFSEDEGISINGENRPYSNSTSSHSFEIVYQKDSTGNIIRDDEGNPIPSTTTDGDIIYHKISKGANQACELDPILHEEILQRAVELAKAAYVGDLSTQLALGNASETNMGVVPQQSNSR